MNETRTDRTDGLRRFVAVLPERGMHPEHLGLDGAEPCEEVEPTWSYLCTRTAGHLGAHEAAAKDRIVARWDA